MVIEHFGDACCLSWKEGFSSRRVQKVLFLSLGQGRLWVAPCPLCTGTECLHAEIKWPGSDNSSSHTFGAVIRNVWIRNYINSYVVMVWALVTARVKLTFLVPAPVTLLEQ